MIEIARLEFELANNNGMLKIQIFTIKIRHLHITHFWHKNHMPLYNFKPTKNLYIMIDRLIDRFIHSFQYIIEQINLDEIKYI